MKYHHLWLCLVTISMIFTVTSVIANDGEVCDIALPPQQGQGGAQYDVFVSNPTRISSQQAGFQSTGCGAATFGAVGTRSGPNDANGNPATQNDIVNACARAGGLSATHAGTFDQYMNGLIALLNNDPANCFQITIKRINRFTDPPVRVLPPPQVSIQRNVRIITHRPYNFGVADIVDAMRRTAPIAGGMGMGGVVYDASNRDTDAHMFQPVAIHSVGRVVGGEREHDFKVYDPYFGRDVDVQIKFDRDDRMYANLWNRGGNPLWFHLEELFFVENVGLCSNLTNWTVNNSGGGGGGSRPVRGPTTGGATIQIPTPTPTPMPGGPTTPTGCGLRNLATNTCTVTSACPNNEYCSFATFCTCKGMVCGDGVRDPNEECDDGNQLNNDGCSATCRREVLCGSTWMLASQQECNPPGSACFRISHGSIAHGVCSNTCTCEPLRQREVD